jgi:amino acid adenylation domain-containing protein
MSRTLQNGLELSAAEKRALLADLLRQQSARARTVPLSYAQQRLWLLAQLEPDSAAYNIPRALRLQGELDVPALRQTFNKILARHEVLRGSFDLVEGQPVQRIATHLEIDIPVVDLEELSANDREAEITRLVTAEAQRPFDLSRDAMLRTSLLRLGNQDHVLLLTMHHIVSDGWSLGILVKEMAAIYQAITEQKPVALPELAIQYADFARWQRDWLQGEVLEQQLSYWRQQLAGAPAVLNLPIAKTRPAMQTTRGSHITKTLAPELQSALIDLCRREGVTLFMTLLAAFQTLLYRYSGQEDIVVGSPIAGRNRAETEDLIGFFVNSLPLRTNLSGNPSFRELLLRVRETALGSYAHQDLPFEKIVEELQPQRDLSYSPIFQVMFALQNQPRVGFSLPGLNVTLLKRETDAAKFDLTLFMTETDDGLSCWLEYNTDLFAAGTITRLLDHFTVLLAAIVANPERAIADLPILSEAERQQLLVEWNDTQTDYPRNQCTHQLFEQQAERTPDAIAVAFKGRTLSYAELNARANQLAHYLRARGVGPDQLVGLCVERSLEMIVGLLGILKAGGAYLPLDPAYPRERLSFMLADGGIEVLLTQDHLLAKLPSATVTTIALDSEWQPIAGEDDKNPESNTSAENLAYVIYTSGSTGRPKGVSVTHRSLVRLVKETDYAHFGPAQVFLQLAPLSFDASTFEIWGPLLNGARLVIMAPGLASLTELGQAIECNRVTTLWLTAGLFQQVAETQLENLRGLRQLLAGGDALSVPHVEKALRELSDCQFINGYGPTESTTFACCYRAKKNERFAGSVPIGRPIANTHVYILDQSLGPAPAGIAGELYIGGDGLARGYLNDAALTAEKFLPNPFGQPGSRMYRTGDRSRYLADGRIEFLGRLDQQVKIRGYRIEPGEIEVLLTQHPGVRECVVVARGEGAGEKRLVAYIVPHPRGSVASEDLRAYLKERLPDYMIPTFCVELAHLPLTPNGKVDRESLPEPEQISSEQFVGPHSDTERRLAAIWANVLGRDEIGVHDNFFDLGGHSLLAVRLMSEIEKEFGRSIPLVSLFQGATIAHLAGVLGQDVAAISWPLIIQIQPGNAKPPLFCVSTPNVNALGYVALARHLGVDQPVYGLQAQYPEDLDGEHSRAAVDQLATEYLEALRAVRPTGPYQFVGLCRGAHIAYEMARRLEREGQQVALLGILDTWVLENTYNRFLYIEYYARRLRSLLRGFNEQLSSLMGKAGSKQGVADGLPEAATGSVATNRKNPMSTYFPGPGFVPKTYNGKITVFRVRGQPLNRIRDRQLGWGRLAQGGVDVHVVPGKHETVLREPNVRRLAEELKKCLLTEVSQRNGKPW